MTQESMETTAGNADESILDTTLDALKELTPLEALLSLGALAGAGSLVVLVARFIIVSHRLGSK